MTGAGSLSPALADDHRLVLQRVVAFSFGLVVPIFLGTFVSLVVIISFTVVLARCIFPNFELIAFIVDVVIVAAHTLYRNCNNPSGRGLLRAPVVLAA